MHGSWRMNEPLSAIEMMQSAGKSAKSLGRPEVWAADRRTIARDLLLIRNKAAYRLAANHHLSSGTDYSVGMDCGYAALRHLNDPKTAQVHLNACCWRSIHPYLWGVPIIGLHRHIKAGTHS